MAVACNGTSGNLWVRESGTLLNYNAAYTWMAWVLFRSLPPEGTNYHIEVLVGGSGEYESLFIGTYSGINYWFAECSTGGVADSRNVVQTISINTWYHIASVRSSTTALNYYLNGVQQSTTITQDVSGRGALFGMDVMGARTNSLVVTNVSDSRIASVKCWSAALTADQILAESATLRPQEYTSLYGWYPVFAGSSERIRDYGGNGRDWTEVGTLTDENQPPVSYGAPVLMSLPSPAVTPPATRQVWLPPHRTYRWVRG